LALSGLLALRLNVPVVVRSNGKAHPFAAGLEVFWRNPMLTILAVCPKD
jgi:hypothetical protein